MISVKSLFLIVAFPFAAYGLDCDDFTVGSCNENQDGLISSNDRVNSAELCQTTCEILADCDFFYFHEYEDGTYLCEHYMDDTRSECKTIGGSPRQNYESCFDNIQVTDGCDRFSELDCTYTGEIDTQLSPPDGQIRSALECEELCVAYEVLGCEYWVFQETIARCQLYFQDTRECQGWAGPKAPLIEKCQVPPSMGFLITGSARAPFTYTEIWSPSGHHCSLPIFNQSMDYFANVATGAVVCGRFNCEKFHGGEWNFLDQSFSHSRDDSSMWTQHDGFIIMGGTNTESKKTSEYLRYDGTVEDSFALKYDTNKACSIEEENYVIITGGAATRNSVTKYDFNTQTDLAPLNDGRYDHGCTSFVTNENQKTYIVAGGLGDSGYLSSTEILIEGDSNWKYAGDLYQKMTSNRLGTMDNRVFSFGGWYMGYPGQYIFLDGIVEFDGAASVWKQEWAGALSTGQGCQSVSLVDINELDYECP